jgi:sugar phosphate isomerase/epimerase
MYLTGFGDEAGGDIDTQIKATKELGWENIESRSIDGKNIHDMPDEAFDVACGKLEEAGVKINCFGSAIANWGKSIEDPFEITVEEINRAIPRMQRLGTKLIRIMSYAVLKDREPNDQMVDERVKRLNEVVKMFSGAGIVPVHENCMNYGGMGWSYTLELCERVPGLKLVYDTGNPVFTDDRTKEKPYPKQSSWEFYSKVKEHLAYIHIKDGVWDSENEKTRFTYPGEGDGDVKEVVGDLLKSGYDGGISIEPHLAVVFHDESVQSSGDVQYSNYVEYGKRMEKLIAEMR